MFIVPQIPIPVLVIHGTADGICLAEGSQEIFDSLPASADKELRMFGGLYHELLNEPEKEEVMAYIQNWIDRKM
tara:strand:- start:661 stop:882 length:222 start_codon:yes stop_codon:yes gene_type:complete